MITINVNHTTHQVPEKINVQGLLALLGIATNGIAVAVNTQVIPKSQWQQYTLHQSEDILIIKATQGG
ncbi:sulfur carrier protein ThiS [Zhouia sp. PK063]|uniref:sulfur carrier protein ThiS n=1 Tax=Zhouia sp. PK063 TaxID=3373602 RepID=UPI0037A032CA